MSRRITIAEDYLELDDIGEHYGVTVNSMNLYYSNVNPDFVSLFQFYTLDEVEKEKEDRLDEVDASLALTLLASIEASFRVDYLRRCYLRRKDPLSRNFRQLYKKRGRRVSFEDDLLDGWKTHSNAPSSLLGKVKGAFNYRHWLAHGRYWIPKYGKRYDFSNIYELAREVDERFPFEKP